MRIDNTPARRVGVALAGPLTGHKSKGRAKGVLRNNTPILGIKVVVKKERRVGSVIDRSEPHRGE
jgi:hypothetical protein